MIIFNISFWDLEEDFICADKEDSIVKYTLPEDNHQIFASKYFTYLPSEEELKRELNLKEFHKKE